MGTIIATGADVPYLSLVGLQPFSPSDVGPDEAIELVRVHAPRKGDQGSFE
jgi:hypothetical protein